jgi:dihydrofolate reductase
MRKFSVVVAMTRNMGIGLNGGLPWKISSDMRYFRKLTVGEGRNVVIVGRKTFDSIGGELSGRLNVVLSKSSGVSLVEGLKSLSDRKDVDEVFVIGGGEVYKEAVGMKECEKIYVSWVRRRDNNKIAVDTFFPRFDDSHYRVNDLGTVIDGEYIVEYSVYERIVNMEEMQYLRMIRDVLESGNAKMDRTGVGTYSVFGRSMRFDLSGGRIPLFTTKRVFWRGAIIGQNNEERVFRINAGTASEEDERQIGVPIAALTESLTVKKPFIGLDMSIDGRREGDYAGRGGEDTSVEFVVRNNLPTRLFHTTVSVSLSGAALDKNKISAGQNGFYRSIDNTIVWDERSVPELADLAPGEEKTFNFKVTPLPYSKVSSGAKPEINIALNAEGERVLDSGSVENVSSNQNRKIVLGTDINIYSKVVRSQGNIENTGPIPPKAEVPTTYTVIWGISNSFNQVSGIEVRAGLPSYVKWTGVYSPGSENISYNQVTNEVVWKAGSVLSNTGAVCK